MGSEWNKNNDSTRSCQRSLCTNGCGYFGPGVISGLCAMCRIGLRLQEESKTNSSLLTGMPRLFSSALDSSKSSPWTGFGTSSGPALPPLTVFAGAKKNILFAKELSEPCRPNKCGTCNKKVGLATGFKCKCGITCCGAHRYPEMHQCSFDYKASGRDQIAKKNPVIKTDKILDRI